MRVIERSSDLPRAAALRLAGALALLVLGCGLPSDSRLRTAYRFIERDPVAFHDEGSEALTTPGQVFGWERDESRIEPSWEVSRRPVLPSVSARWAGGPVEVDAVTFRRETAFAASAVDLVELRISGDAPARDSATLFWARAGTPGTGTDNVVARGTLLPDGTGRVFRFEVSGHPGWSGEIEQLLVRLFARPEAVPTVDRLVAMARVFSPSGLAEASRGFRLTLDDETRSSILALPGMDVAREVELPRDARLRVAWGVQGSPREAVRFQVLAEAGPGKSELLLDTAVEPGPQVGRWHSGEVDLSHLGGRPVRLTLRTSSTVPIAPEESLPVWANPEIVAPESFRLRRPTRPNVLLISADTLRADRLSLYGHDRPTTPWLDEWAARSATVFRDAVAPSPWTLPSHVSLFTGLDAHRHGVVRGSAPATLETLAETLRAAGWSTAAVTGGGYLHPGFGFVQGFDRYRYYAGRVPTGPRPDVDRTAELDESLEHALAMLDELADRPFFLFFHTFETHQPFRARQPWFGRFSRLPEPEEPLRPPRLRGDPKEGFQRSKPLDLEVPEGVDAAELLRDVYDSSVAFLDDRIHRLLSALEAKGLADETIVVFTSDHGELLGERGLAGHYYLWDENLLVPLVISAPGRARRVSEVREQVRLLDVHPTVLDLLGLPVPEGLDGTSLVPLLEGRGGEARRALSYASTSNRGIAVRLDGRRKYVFDNTAWPPHSGTETAYSIEANGETELPASELARYASLRQGLIKRLRSESPGIEAVFVNRGATEVRGRLESPLVAPNSVKAIELPCDCVSWEMTGDLSFRIPPRGRFAIKIEGLTNPGLWLRIEAEPGGPFERFDQHLLPAADGTPISVTRVGGSWRAGPAPEAAAPIAITLSWTGPEVSDTTAPKPESDPRLTERLEALGYLD